jgi:hypothetical protein
MFAAARTATSAASPDQPGVGMDMPTRIGCVLRLVRRLIDYGRQVADTVQQRASAPGFARFARPFGTTDLAVILARITRGLRRAAALETRLCRRAARDQPLASKPFRTSPTHEPRPARRPATQPAAPPKSRTTDPRLANLPTEDEIAAEVRRRPIGAVIVDICGDLGIAPGQLDRAFWEEISHAIMMYGGSLSRFLRNLHTGLCAFGRPDGSDDAVPGWAAAPPLLSAPSTGPP